jgi:predicted GTPase
MGPTLGLEYRSAPKAVEMLNLKIIDVGGHEVYQQTFWELAIERADAVLFVIDATITKEDQPIVYEMMIRQFDYAIDIVPEFKPLLFLLNKQDLVELKPMSPADAIKLFDPKKIEGRSIRFLPTSAKYGDGVIEAIEFLISVYQEKHHA